jgi:methionyl-tRNA synthetase
VVAGIAEHYSPEQMVGKQVVMVANLKPAVLMGETSQGMLLAAKDGKRLVLVQPETSVKSGAKVA